MGVRGSVVMFIPSDWGGEGGGFTGPGSVGAAEGARRVVSQGLRGDRGAVTRESTDGGKGTMSVPRSVTKRVGGGAGRDGNYSWPSADRAGGGASHVGAAEVLVEGGVAAKRRNGSFGWMGIIKSVNRVRPSQKKRALYGGAARRNGRVITRDRPDLRDPP